MHVCCARTVTGSYHEYQDDSLDDIIMSEELKKAFAKERKKAREKEDKAMLVRPRLRL
jgi:hypothetical protein